MNEIYKGMDNAAEQINENFLNGSIVESGENENGEYLRFGNGWQICIPHERISLERVDSTSMSGSWEFPIPFVSNPFVPFSKNTSGNKNYRRAGESINIYRDNDNVLRAELISDGAKSDVIHLIDESSDLFELEVGDNLISANDDEGGASLTAKISFSPAVVALYES